jgi:cobalt/nickel transport system permease protein
VISITHDDRSKVNMHIPDGFLSPEISIITFIITIVFWILAFLKAKNSLDERQVPIMGLLTALFFAAQMMNYPIAGGTTGHLLGGASLGIILGPYAGCISITIILVLQSLLFGDGGITTLGANVLNMGIIGVFVPAFLLLALNKISKGKGWYVWVFISAFIGDVLAAIAAGTELGFSVPTFTYGISVTVPAMALNHSVIGVIEGVVTMVLIGVLLKLRPDVLSKSPSLKDLPELQESNN